MAENMGTPYLFVYFLLSPGFFPLLDRSHQNDGKRAVVSHGKVFGRRHSAWSYQAVIS